MEEELEYQPAKKSLTHKLLVGFLASIIALAGFTLGYIIKDQSVFPTAKSPVTETNQEPFSEATTPINTAKNKLFYAEFTRNYSPNTTGSINYSLYDFTSNDIVETGSFPLEEEVLTAGNFNMSAANSSVQYDAMANAIYYQTDGSSDYDGSCINLDGTCNNKIFKYDVATQTTSTVFVSEYRYPNWILSPKNNAIYLSRTEAAGALSDPTHTIEVIDLATGSTKVIYQNSYEYGTQVASLFMTEQEDVLYQAVAFRYPPNPKNGIRIQALNVETNAMEQITITNLESSSTDTYLSSDGRYFAFWQGPWLNDNLYVYDLQENTTTQVEFPGKIDNYNLLWSTDNKTLYYSVNGSIYAYSITNKQSKLIIPGDSKRYLSYAVNEEVLLYGPLPLLAYNLETGTSIPTPFPSKVDNDGNIVSISWH